jgi:hypothetical protein
MGLQDEVQYCGKCRRQQQPSQGEKCIHCGKQTVVWDINRQKEEEVMKAWRHINGLPTSF